MYNAAGFYLGIFPWGRRILFPRSFVVVSGRECSWGRPEGGSSPSRRPRRGTGHAECENASLLRGPGRRSRPAEASGWRARLRNANLLAYDDAPCCSRDPQQVHGVVAVGAVALPWSTRRLSVRCSAFRTRAFLSDADADRCPPSLTRSASPQLCAVRGRVAFSTTARRRRRSPWTPRSRRLSPLSRSSRSRTGLSDSLLSAMSQWARPRRCRCRSRRAHPLYPHIRWDLRARRGITHCLHSTVAGT